MHKSSKESIIQISVGHSEEYQLLPSVDCIANVPAIYCKMFWKTMSYNEKTGFVMSWDILKKPIELSPDTDELCVINLGGQILHLIQCIQERRSGASDKPRHPVLQMLWGIVTQTNVDHAELIWEEFTQGIQTYFSHKASLKNPKKKATPSPIP
ncbi:hypothetical protein Tco_1407515 [Tanacetum coccineum]